MYISRIITLITLVFVISACSNEYDKPSKNTDNPNHIIEFESQNPVFFDDSYIKNVNRFLNIESQFRNQNDPLLDTIQWVINYQNNLEQMIPNVILKFGYPVWSESEIYRTRFGSDKVTFVPLISEESASVNAILIMRRYNDFIDFKILDRNRLYNYYLEDNINESNVIEYSSFLHFDQELFNYNDPLLQPFYDEYQVNNVTNPEVEQRGWEVCICTHWNQAIKAEDIEVQSRDCENWECYWYNDNSSGGGSGWGSTGGIGNIGENTEGGTIPGSGSGGSNSGGPTEEGSSGFGGIEGEINPENWWDEYVEDELLFKLITDLNLNEDEVGCLEKFSTLKAVVEMFNDNIKNVCDNTNTDDILKQAINDACNCNDRSICSSRVEEFYKSFGATLVGDPIDWTTASPEQKGEIIFKVIRWNYFRESCISNTFNINFTAMFTNLPTWNVAQADDFNVKACIDTNLHDVSISFQGAQSCNNCMLAQVCPPRVLQNGNWAFDFSNCNSGCTIGGSADVPCLTMQIASSKAEIFHNYLLAKDWECK